MIDPLIESAKVVGFERRMDGVAYKVLLDLKDWEEGGQDDMS